MHLRGFLKTGHWPSLLCAFLYFDLSFMVWVLLGAVANSIVADLGLNEVQRGLMLALPLLGGSVLRLVLGILADRWGARRTGIVGLMLTLIPLVLGWLWADSFAQILLVGLLLGVAGASFAVALPLASRWYPPHYQGIALGIAGAGNSGTCLATLFGPLLAQWLGWHAVFGLALVPILGALVVFMLLAKDCPNQPAPKRWADYAAVLKQRDTWWFCLFYAVTFGGFVGLAVFLNSFFHVQYGLNSVTAGYCATLCVLAGSFLRPVGGYLADRFGGIRLLIFLYVGAGGCMLLLTDVPPLAIGVSCLFLGMGILGMGNGAVFQLVPQRFPTQIGVLTGIVGAAGGLGGFFLPNLLGNLRHLTGSFAGGFLIFGAVAIACGAAVRYVSHRWEGAFVGRGGVASGSAPAETVPAEAIATA